MQDNNLSKVENHKEVMPVAKLELRMLESLLNAIIERAAEEGMSPPRWVGAHLAEFFEIPIAKAMPPLGTPGRRRNKLLANGKGRR